MDRKYGVLPPKRDQDLRKAAVAELLVKTSLLGLLGKTFGISEPKGGEESDEEAEEEAEEAEEAEDTENMAMVEAGESEGTENIAIVEAEEADNMAIVDEAHEKTPGSYPLIERREQDW